MTTGSARPPRTGPAPTDERHRKRIAIVGGGCAALAAAWDLTSPDNEHPCDVTVFQIGGRLGGKGASSRNSNKGERIEEHGLHLWLGYYENAFAMVRRCYEELKRRRPDDPELQRVWRSGAFNDWDWLAAFERASVVGLADRVADDWVPWVARFPEYVLRSDGGVGLSEADDGAGLPGVHIVDDARRAYPGEPFTSPAADEETADVAFFLTHALRELQAFVASLEDRIEQTQGQTERAAFADEPDALLAHALKSRSPERGRTSVPDALRLLRVIRLTILVPAVQAVATVARVSQGPLPYVRTQVVAMLDRFVDEMRAQIEEFVLDDVVARRLWELIDLLTANIRGIIAARLEGHDDFSTLDDWNYIDWLRMNRVAERTLRNPIVRGAHDLAFAYAQGNEQEPQFAAGQALNAACRFFFTYKGALFWRMRAGMGEVVFAPLYMALRQRGVKFRFFHQLTDIELNESQTAVSRLTFEQQVRLKETSPDAATNYQPLRLVENLACWRDRPDTLQFDYDTDTLARLTRAVEGHDEATNVNFESVWCNWKPSGGPVAIEIGPPTNKTDRKGGTRQDRYDAALVTVPVAALEMVSGRLLEAGETGERWRHMFENLGTVATQSVQLWTTRETWELGWAHGQVSFSGFVHPFDTWADLSHLRAVELQHDVKGVHYLCSALPEHLLGESLRMPARSKVDLDELAAARTTVKDHARQFLTHTVLQLWPKAVKRYPSAFEWKWLFDQGERSGVRRLEGQHVVANVDPSERYTQSLPGTTKYRIAPDGTGFDGLYIAGDWTDCGLNFGCVEAAVMSGRLASSAISGYPVKEKIPGYPHKDCATDGERTKLT